MLSFLPLSHTYERQVGQFIPFQCGCTIAYCEKPATLIRDLQIFEPSYLVCVPRIFERIFMAIRDLASHTKEGKKAFDRAMEIGVKVIDCRADESGFIDMGFDVNLGEDLPEDLKEDYKWADEKGVPAVKAATTKISGQLFCLREPAC